jgi:hypothetical protein
MAAMTRKSCIDAAADFVAAQPGGAHRILDRHRRDPSGNCSGCRHAPTPWPCTLTTIARSAARGRHDHSADGPGSG